MRHRNLDTRYRDRQTGQLTQACAKPEVKFEYLLKHNGVKVILTDHCRTRAAQRHGMPVETMKDYFIRVVDGLKDFEWKEYNQEIFAFCRHYQRGAVVAYRRDFKNQASREMILAVVTIYPYGKAVPAHPDTETVYC